MLGLWSWAHQTEDREGVEMAGLMEKIEKPNTKQRQFTGFTAINRKRNEQ